MLILQRVAGNRAVSGWMADLTTRAPQVGPAAPVDTGACRPVLPVIQRIVHPTANAAEFIDWVQTQAAYTKWGPTQGDCAPAAKAIGFWLSGLGYANVRYRGILLFALPSSRSTNRNHFVVVVGIDGTDVVIDPTQGQFGEGAAQVARHEDWVAQFKTVLVDNLLEERDERRASRYRDGGTFGDANAFASSGTASFSDFDDPILVPLAAACVPSRRTCTLI